MRKSKYLGMKSEQWECTHTGIASVQPAFTHYKDALGRRVRSKSPGSRQYYYIFERPTSDGKALKMIRLSAKQVLQVATGFFTVEDFAKRKEIERSPVFTKKVSYSFTD